MQHPRVVVIGAGRMGRRHLDVLSKLECAVVAVCDPDEQRAAEAAAKAGCAAYADVETMLSRTPCDCAFVCIPPFAHGLPERRLIERRIPFLVEKPVAHSFDTAAEIEQLLATSGMWAAAGYQWRYSDMVEQAREALTNVQPFLVSACWIGPPYQPEWWLYRERSGGQIVERTTHVVDLARYLFGEVETVYAAQAPAPAGTDGDVAPALTATIRFASGLAGQITGVCRLPMTFRVGVDVFSPDGVFHVSGERFITTTSTGVTHLESTRNAVQLQDEAFLAAVASGDPGWLRCLYPDAAETLRITAATQRSAETGELIQLGSRLGAARLDKRA